MKTEASNPRVVQRAPQGLERLAAPVSLPAPARPVRSSLAAQVCNRTFLRDWVGGRAGQPIRRF